jgi:hypothetical protein
MGVAQGGGLARTAVKDSVCPVESICTDGSSNVAAKWLVPLLCVREVPDSNVGPQTGYPE